MLNKSINKPQVTTTTSNYFSGYRADREAVRDQELLYYDAIIANENTTEEDRKAAQDARLALVAQMGKELVIEGLIKAKGFEDAIITISNGYVNAVVKCDALDQTQANQIRNIIQTQLGTDIEHVKVMRAG